MAGYGGYPLAEVDAAIRPGQPTTPDGAAGIFAGVAPALVTLAEEIPVAISAVSTGGDAAFEARSTGGRGGGGADVDRHR